MYSGCMALVIGNSVKAGVRFVSYDKFKRALADKDVSSITVGLVIMIDRLTRRPWLQGKSQCAAKSFSRTRCRDDGGHLRRHAFRNDQVRHLHTSPLICPPPSPPFFFSFLSDIYVKLIFGHVFRTKLIDDAKRPQPRYRGLLHGTASIVREEGLRGVYRGLFPVVHVEPPNVYSSR